MFSAIRNLWRRLRAPSNRWALGTLLGTGFVAGIAGWIGFNATLAWAQTDEFCGYACHSLRTHLTPEWEKSIHYSNRTGVRAGCADCHLAKEFFPKMYRKTRALWSDVPGELFGWIDTKEEFEAKRLHMAEIVWAEMRANDSRECRNCHNRLAWDPAAQSKRGREEHEEAKTSGKTCIDCHKGVAHTKPDLPAEEGEAEDFSL